MKALTNIFKVILIVASLTSSFAFADEGMKITCLTAGISAEKFDEAVAWYSKILGPRQLIQPVPGVAEFELTNGAWLQIFQTQKTTVGDAVLRLGIENIEVEYSRLKKLGVKLGEIDRIEGVIAMFDFADPFGNKLSLYQVLQ